MTVRVGLTCNDNSGQFAGKFDCAEFNSEDEFDCMIDGEYLPLEVVGRTLRIGTHRFDFDQRNVWEGSWQWDTFEMSDAEARRLFQLLISKQWVVTEYVHGGMFDDLIEETNT